MNSKSKIVTWPTLKRKVAALREEGRVIAFTNGCFDILHRGHVAYLEKAKKKDRVLVLGLNSDRSVRAIKGPGRPVNDQTSRALVMAALACVDFVAIFDEDTPENLIAAVQPDVLIKGADWRGKPIAGSEIVRSRGGRVELISYIDGYSTTNTIHALQKK